MSFSRVWQLPWTLAASLCLVNAAPLALAQGATEPLTGTAWQLIQFHDSQGQTLAPEAGSHYTVEFRTDNTVAARLDCHRGRGTWVSRSPLQLELGPLALTRATCPQAPVRDQLAKRWPAIRSYSVRDTHLFLSLPANGGSYEFEPVQNAGAAATAVAPPSATTALPATTTAPATATATPPSAAAAVTQTTGAPPSITAPTPSTAAATQTFTASWLDPSKPVSWNRPGASIPRPPRMEQSFDPRCRTSARSPELAADKQLADLGWDLIGAYQGGWGMLVIEGAAGYDGMCRPRAYQVFVFLHGVFAGTLSPGTMDSRADGSLNRVMLAGDGRLTAEYARYARTDALCCPSRAATVVFEIATDQTVRPVVSTSTSSSR